MPTLFPFSTAFRAEDLPDTQRLALEALLQGGSKAEAAQHARTSERTLRRWLRDPRFMAALRQARCDAWLETTTALQRLNQNALAALQRVLDSDNPRAQVYAAKVVFELTIKALDVEAMCGRIAQAEADLEAHLNGGTRPTFYSDPEDGEGNEDPGNTPEPAVPAKAGTPQGEGAARIHPVAQRRSVAGNVHPGQGGDPACEVSSTTVRGCPWPSEPAPEPAKTGQTRPRLASERPEGDSHAAQGFIPGKGRHPSTSLRTNEPRAHEQRENTGHFRPKPDMGLVSGFHQPSTFDHQRRAAPHFRALPRAESPFAPFRVFRGPSTPCDLRVNERTSNERC